MKKRKMSIVVAILIMLVGWLYWANGAIQKTTYRIESNRIPEAFDEYKIIHISDFHNARFGKGQKKLLKKLEEGAPDMIAITGDLIDSNHTDIEAAMELIRASVKIAPVFYVTGNHEAWSASYGVLKEQLLEAGVTILENDAVLIEREGEQILLAGVEDPDFSHSYREANVILKEKLDGIRKEGDYYRVLLSHRPECLDTYVKEGYDLVLSGHAHGGQVRIPLVGGIVAPNQGLFPRYTEGLHEKGKTNMLISRGLGNSVVPLRINNRPEIVQIILQRAS